MISVTKQQVANYLIVRVGFDSDRPLLTILDNLSCIQVDPVNVVSRSHELALYNRNKSFKKSDLYTELYQKHTLFEFWQQLYSIIPISGYPYLRAIQDLPAQWHREPNDWQTSYRTEHSKELAAVLQFIADHGATTSKDLSHLAKGAAVLSWKGESSHKALLEFLWNAGEVQVIQRHSNTKVYDLTERVLPQSILEQKVSPDAGYKYLVDSHFKYFGLLRTPNLTRSGRSRVAGVRAEFKRQLVTGEISEVKIEDITTSSRYFIKSIEAEKINNSTENTHVGLNILSPLDPFLIDRQLLLDVFDFFYRWEGYTPEALRKFGYYNMPIFYRGKIVGQIDLAKNNTADARRLEIKNLYLPEKSKEITQALNRELENLEQFSFT
jgi:uncharacterized protein